MLRHAKSSVHRTDWKKRRDNKFCLLFLLSVAYKVIYNLIWLAIRLCGILNLCFGVENTSTACYEKVESEFEGIEKSILRSLKALMSPCIHMLIFTKVPRTKSLAHAFNISLTFLLLLILSNCLCVHSPMLCDPQSSSPTLAYVKVMDPMGKKYVRNIKTTLYLQWKRERARTVVNVRCDYNCNKK